MDHWQFRRILKKYLHGNPTADEKKIIDSWYNQLGQEGDACRNSVEETELEARYWAGIHSHIRKKSVLSIYPKKSTWPAIGIAASILLALFSYIYLNHWNAADGKVLSAIEKKSLKWASISNTGENPRVITLPDQSKVTLESQSKLKFSQAFDEKERAVYLDGEAFFEVTPNAERPFLVHANQLTTKVLGTSFCIKAFQDEKSVTLAVKTGKVSVYTNDKVNEKTPEIILTPNQKIVYDKTENKLLKMIVDSPQPMIPAEQIKRMRFEGASVVEIFEAIEKIYGVDIVFEEDKFSSCTLTTSISDGGIYNRLDIICQAIGARYELSENQILIIGSGCNYP